MSHHWLNDSDPEKSAISFEDWGKGVVAAISGPDGEEKTRAIEAVANLTKRLDGMWNDGGGAYAFAPQKDLTIAEDEWVIAY